MSCQAEEAKKRFRKPEVLYRRILRHPSLGDLGLENEMKIIIVDDTQENLDAARIASSKFPDHQFLLVGNASEAAAELANVDGIITDLFFPQEEGYRSDSHYMAYMSRMTTESPVFKEVVDVYYDGWFRQAEEKLDDVLGLLKDGTIRVAVERLIALFERRGSQSSAQEYRELLKNLPDPQFPYGAGLMLKAKNLGKRCCLVTYLHRHAGGYKDAVGALDGMILLFPLIEAGILTVKQAKHDGYDSLTYLGGASIWSYGKESPYVWAEAIRLLEMQKTG